MGSDLFESYTAAVVATIIMAIGMGSLKYIALPLVLIAIGLVCSLLTISLSRFISKVTDVQSFFRNITYVAGALFVVGAYVAITVMTGKFSLFLVVLAGVLCGVLIGVETEYFASGPPIRYIINMSKTGASTNVIAGLTIGFLGAFLPIITICATILITLYLAGPYGIGLSSVGMLSTMGIIMSLDAYGPIVDNAGGIAQMTRATPEVRRITDRLDVVGNITAAIGKGFTIGTGVITAIALFAAYIVGTRLEYTKLFSTRTIVGLFIGVSLPFLFAALTMGSVSRIANRLIVEVRRQFRKMKGEGAAETDPDRCIDIATRDSLRDTVAVGTISIAAPFIVVFTLGVEALGGFLVGALITGSVLGMSMTIGGVAWDNAKKWFERERKTKGETETAYESAVVGDLVGDPFKDVSGPSMNILIKLMITISLVFCSIFCKL